MKMQKKHLLVGALALLLITPVLAADSGSTPTPPTKPAAPVPLTDEEKKELTKARAAALKASPDLVAEQKDIADQQKAVLDHQKALKQKIDDAAVKADPAIAPILAKIAANSASKNKPTAPETPAPKKKPATKPKSSTATPSTNAPSATPPTSASTSTGN